MPDFALLCTRLCTEAARDIDGRCAGKLIVPTLAIPSLVRAGVAEPLAAQLAGHEVKKGVTYGSRAGKLLSATGGPLLSRRLDYR